MAVKKRRMRGRTRVWATRQPGLIVADKTITSLTYSSAVAYAPGVDQEDRIFNINSIFDPDRSGVGHQPQGRDQYAAFYNRYRVLKCSWDVTMAPQTAGGSYNCIVLPSNDATSIAGINQDNAIESPWAKYKTASVYSTTAGVGPLPLRIRGSIRMSKLYGVSEKTLRDDDRYAAEMSASPAELAVLHVLTTSALAASTINYHLIVKLVYEVEMFDRVQLSAS